MTEPLHLLTIGTLPALDASCSLAEVLVVAACDTLAEGLGALASAERVDAVVLDGRLPGAPEADLEAIASRVAVVVAVDDPDAEHALAWLRRGAQDVIRGDDPIDARRIRFAVERCRAAQAREPKYSTDVSTGLPHRQQLIEHLCQLLALREREPSPMAVLVLRVVSAVAAGEALSATDGQALRRKLAVRLRSALRASDVVAWLGEDSFAVLLGSMLVEGDADQVAAKLVAAMRAPCLIGGNEVSIAVATGISQFPKDGALAEKLLRRAAALAAVAPPADGGGPAHAHDARGNERAAANDEI